MEVPVLLVYSLIRYYWSERLAILALTATFLVLLEIESIRLEVKPKIPKHLNVFRKRERTNVTGTFFFISATIIVFGAFDYSIALLSLLLTVFGDLASALIGIKFGKHKLYRKKTYEGFLAGLLMNLVVGAIVLPEYPLIYIGMAIVASTVELLTSNLDDNLTVPLSAAFTGQMITYIIQANLAQFPGSLQWIFNFFPR